MTGPDHQPALDALGDQLEAAAARSVGAGGVAPGSRGRGRLVLLPVVALFAVLAITAALLVPGGGESAEAAVQSAAQQTEELSTGRFQIDLVASGAGLPGDVAVTVTGAYDAGADRFQATVDLSDVAGGLAAEGFDLLGSDPTLTTIVDGGTVYVSTGLFGSLFNLDAEWIRISISEMFGGEALPGGEEMFGPATMDPTSFLDMLDEFGGDVAEVGREQVRGVDTTRYAGVVDLGAIALDSGLNDQLGQFLPGDFELPSVPVDVWVDDADLVRKVQVSASMADVGDVSVTIEYFDLGEPVDIPVPSGDQVTDLNDVFGDLGSMFSGDLGSGDLGELFGGFEDLDLSELEDMFGDFDTSQIEGMVDDLLGDIDPAEIEAMIEKFSEQLGAGELNLDELEGLLSPFSEFTEDGADDNDNNGDGTGEI